MYRYFYMVFIMEREKLLMNKSDINKEYEVIMYLVLHVDGTCCGSGFL